MLRIEDLVKLKDCQIINKNILQTQEFGGVSIDSRSCRSNDLFFAIKGEKRDGHSFLNDVFKKGLSAAVVEKKWYKQYGDNNKNKAYVVVNNTTKALGELARNYRRKFLIPVLAVAGSNGKTTTRDMIVSVLSKRYKVLKTENNLNNQYGVPLTLFRLRKKHNFCVIEMGTNHFGEIKYLCNVAEPQFGVITNIANEHLQFFKNINGVADAEGELIDYIKNTYGTFFLNKDDYYIKRRIGGRFKHYFSYASKNSADVRGKVINYNRFYPRVSVRYGKLSFNEILKVIGSQSFYSVLCAAAIGFYFEVPFGELTGALTKFRIITKRRNELFKRNGFWIIDDTYNSNPDSVYVALENFEKYHLKAEIHIVLSDMLELGKRSGEEHFNVGRKIHKLGFKNLYTYGTESYNTYLGAKGIKNNFYFIDKNTLIEFLRYRLKKNDVVFIKGSHSMKMDEVVDAI